MNCNIIFRIFLLICLMTCGASARAGESNDYRLGAGDIIHITVFPNPDLTTDVRVSESGFISYPMIGKVKVGNLTLDAAEQKIAHLLESGGFVHDPQVNIVPTKIIGNQVSVLGHVSKPGLYPLDTFDMKVSNILAEAGGIAENGADVIILVGKRDGKPFRKEIDIPEMFMNRKIGDDVLVRGGDAIYVHRAPMFYIYGEVQRPGIYRVERNMNVMRALAEAGGPTQRGTVKGLKLYREKSGKTEELTPDITAPLQGNDVLYIEESLF
ncbi:MAG TPA: polysaccharide export protein EpsE [Burkholderiales bacterium]|nr:polysaccharide export protein EpsE [Burkholderiales bacterium]